MLTSGVCLQLLISTTFSSKSQAATTKTWEAHMADVCLIYYHKKEYIHLVTGTTLDGHWRKIVSNYIFPLSLLSH